DVDVPRIAVTLPYSPGNMQAAACTLFPIHVSEDTGLTCLSDARQTSVVPPLIADLRGNGNQASLPHCVHLRPVILTSFPIGVKVLPPREGGCKGILSKEEIP